MDVIKKNDLIDLDAVSGAVVVLDIFRASNTLISLLTAGVDRVYLIADLDRAYEMKQDRPDRLLFGERNGVTQPGFDGGNSPCQAARLGEQGLLTGKTVILTTSAGTQAIHRLPNAEAIFFGSFANASAVVEAVKATGCKSVHLLAMGLRAEEPAEEDDLCADYLARLLKGERPDFEPYRQGMLACKGGDRLRSHNQDDDLEFCTSLDIRTGVARVTPGDPAFARLNGSTP